MNQQSQDVYPEFRDMVRRLAVDKVAPNAAEIDATSSPPVASYAAFREAGLLGLPFPEALGGQNGDLFSQVIAVEEFARVCATSALTLLTSWAALDPIVHFGSEELKNLLIPAAASGKIRAAWCLTEPRGGSDLPGMITKAERRGNDWVINGTKRFITNATWADWYLVLARTGEKDYGIFMVHRDDKGISFSKLEKKMGLRGSPTADVVFDNCVVSSFRVVGDPTHGYPNMMLSLSYSRPLIAAQALGIAQGALDEAVKYTQERNQFGQPIARFQMVRGMIADMAVKVESSRALLYRAVEAAMDGNDPDKARCLASMAKLLCSDSAMSVTTDAVQLHGGYGYLQDYPVERMMRDAKITQIYEGTNQIQRLIIAKHVYQG